MSLRSIDIGYRISIPITPEHFADSVQREEWREEKGMIVLKLWSDVHRRTPIDVFIYEPLDFATEYAATKMGTGDGRGGCSGSPVFDTLENETGRRAAPGPCRYR